MLSDCLAAFARLFIIFRWRKGRFRLAAPIKAPNVVESIRICSPHFQLHVALKFVISETVLRFQWPSGCLGPNSWLGAAGGPIFKLSCTTSGASRSYTCESSLCTYFRSRTSCKTSPLSCLHTGRGGGHVTSGPGTGPECRYSTENDLQTHTNCAICVDTLSAVFHRLNGVPHANPSRVLLHSSAAAVRSRRKASRLYRMPLHLQQTPTSRRFGLSLIESA